MSEIVSFGHRQLWVVLGEGWKLPIFCDPYTDDTQNITHWAVRPAIRMPAEALAKLAELFLPANIGEDPNLWIISEESLRKLAQEVPGCMPEDYFAWKVTQSEPDSEPIEPEEETKDEFLEFCCRRHNIDLSVGRFVWRAIKESMLYWFKNEQKPINMEILTLHPMPFRANWKDITLAKYRSSAKFFRCPREEWMDRLTETGFIQDLGSVDLLAMKHPGIVVWSVEVEMHKLLTAELIDGESKRRRGFNEAWRYAKYYEGCVRRRLEDILTVYAAWLRQVDLPVGAIRKGGHGRFPVLVPRTKRFEVFPACQRPSDVTYQLTEKADSKVYLKAGQRVRFHVQSKIAKVLKLPDISLSIENVRELSDEATPDVVQPRHYGNGDGGLRVLHTVQGETEAGGLLAEGKESES